MSADPWIHFACDHEGCNARLELHQWSAKERFIEEDWSIVDGKHYCHEHGKPGQPEEECTCYESGPGHMPGCPMRKP